jgi:hypothetical protein
MCQIEVYCEEQYYRNAKMKLLEYTSERNPHLAQMVLRNILMESKPMAWATFRLFREKIGKLEVTNEQDRLELLRLILALRHFGSQCRYFEKEARALCPKLPQDTSIQNCYSVFLNNLNVRNN